MDPFAASIAKSIEDEVERRVSDKITSLLRHMSDEYDIPLKTLVRLMDRSDVQMTQCVAMNKNGKRCRNAPKKNGYCNRHQHLHHEAKYKSPEIKTQHNHSLPPLYMHNCPACNNGKPLRDLVDCFDRDDKSGDTSSVSFGIF